MEKAVAAVLTLFVVLMMLDVAPMIAAERPVVKPKIPLVPMDFIKGDGVSETTECPQNGSCNNHQTCCMALNGYGCCGASNANCCFDYKTCCMSGHVCDDANNQCLPAGSSLPEEDTDVLEKLK